MDMLVAAVMLAVSVPPGNGAAPNLQVPPEPSAGCDRHCGRDRAEPVIAPGARAT
jgi:hypothetical protein